MKYKQCYDDDELSAEEEEEKDTPRPRPSIANGSEETVDESNDSDLEKDGDNDDEVNGDDFYGNFRREYNAYNAYKQCAGPKQYDDDSNDDDVEKETAEAPIRPTSRLLTKRASNEYLAVKNSTTTSSSSIHLQQLSLDDKRKSTELPTLDSNETNHAEPTDRHKQLHKTRSDLLPMLCPRRVSVSDRTKRLVERSRSVDKFLEYTRPSSSFSRVGSPSVNDGRFLKLVLCTTILDA